MPTARPSRSSPVNVVITGAGAGVGRACAFRFAKSGARLGLISRDAASLVVLEQELAAAGALATAIAPLDVCDADAVEAAAAAFEVSLGPIDVWVNDAMVTVFSPVSAITPAEYRRVTEVTYLGTVHGAMAAVRRMRPRGRGQIINIGSALAYRGIPLQSAYCGAKHAIRGFTASLRTELLHEKSRIGVTIIELPAMNTPQFDWARTHMPRQPKPMGTIYQPEVAAEAVFRAAKHRPHEYWVGFSTLLTIVGNMILPAFMDWYLARTAVVGQETTQSVRPDRRDNLYEPVTDLHRTRGVFDSASRKSAMILSGVWTRGAIVACGALVFFLVGWAVL
jgi:short-subunit dehydrogenase